MLDSLFVGEIQWLIVYNCLLLTQVGVEAMAINETPKGTTDPAPSVTRTTHGGTEYEVHHNHLL